MNNAGIVDLVPPELRRGWVNLGWYPNQSVFQMFRHHAQQQPKTPEMRAVFEQARKQKEANEMRIFENQIKKDWR